MTVDALNDFFVVYEPSYDLPAKVMLHSLGDCAPAIINGFVLVREKYKNSFVRLDAWVKEKCQNISLKMVVVPEAIYGEIDEKFPMGAHFKPENWFRLYVFELIDDFKSKNVVYLDLDLVFRSWPVALFEDKSDLAGGLLAVSDVGYAAYRDLELKSADEYFNSGVMLIDTRSGYVRSCFISARMFAIKNPDKCIYVDQCALNYSFSGSQGHLSVSCNFQTGYFFERPDLFSSACVLHCTGSNKPWKINSGHPFRRFFHIAAKSSGISVFQRYDWCDFFSRFFNRLKKETRVLLGRVG